MTTLAPVIDLAERRRSVNALVAEHRSWALNLMHCFVAYTDDWPALESVTLEALWQAARRFDPANGTKFTTWANRRIFGAVRDEQRRRDRLSRFWRVKAASEALDRRDEYLIALQEGMGQPLSLDAPLLPLDRKLTLADVIPAPVAEDDVDIRQLAQAAKLTDRQRECVVRYLDGETLTQIGKTWGCTESNVSVHLAKAKKRLRVAAKRAGLVEGGDAA
jgi:RNA polymerase sigma factor (sigma-70 family)